MLAWIPVLVIYFLCQKLAECMVNDSSQYAGPRLPRRTQDVAEFVLGIYGPITSISTTFLATAIAFDLDFRKKLRAVPRSAIRTTSGDNPKLESKSQDQSSNWYEQL